MSSTESEPDKATEAFKKVKPCSSCKHCIASPGNLDWTTWLCEAPENRLERINHVTGRFFTREEICIYTRVSLNAFGPEGNWYKISYFAKRNEEAQEFLVSTSTKLP